MIEGIGFSGFRSIGKEPVLLYPLKKINLLIGPNNSGKTNINLFLSKYWGTEEKYSDLDYHEYDHSIPHTIFYPFSLSSFLSQIDESSVRNAIEKVLKSKEAYYDSGKEISWGGGFPIEWEYYTQYMREVNNNDISQELYKRRESYYSGNDSQAMTKNFLLIFQKYLSLIGKNWKPPEVVYIPAIRDLFDNTQNPFLDGEKIIEKLEKLRDPAFSDEKSPKLFSRIESFVQNVLEEPETHIVVPNERNTIQLLRNDGKRYELSQLGTGIHEIIYLAIVTTLFPDSFICIDEPELHMHPRLQRRLMQYLNTNTACQYLISTHSAHLIDSDTYPSVFKVWMEKDHTTHLAYAGSNADKLEICNLLGYKASDLLQSNCVIWVEGPSDRLYLNYWIQGKASDLIEGVHYSIMFYGGRLLSHLSGDDGKDEKNLINLLRINQHSWILIDSDKEREDDTINGTKQRIVKEFKDHCWVTEGREIENYLPKADFEAALQKTEVSLPNRLHIGKYDNRLKYSGKEILSKVDFAKDFVNAYQKPDYDTDDLNTKIDSLVTFIRKANQQEPTMSS